MIQKRLRLRLAFLLFASAVLAPRAEVAGADAGRPLLVVSGNSPRISDTMGAAQPAGRPRYQLSIDVDTQARVLRGRMTLTFPNTTGGGLRDAVLRLYPNFPPDVFGDGGDLRMDVHNVRTGGAPATVRYEALGTAARVSLPAEVPPGGEVGLELDWSATIKPLEESDGSFALTSYYPMLAAWSGGWRTDVTAFPDRIFAEAAAYHVTISVPAGLQVLTTGSTVGVHDMGGKSIYEATVEVAREFAFSIGQFVVARADHDGIAVNVYHKPGDGLDEAARLVALHAAASLLVFNERFGRYPYAELDFHLINARRGYDIGAEFPGLIYLLVNGGYTNSTRFITAHEVAHQWWYGTVGNDIYREPWLDEGFAQWSAVLVEEFWGGPAAATRVYEQEIAQRARRTSAPCGLAITDYGSWSLYYAAVYGRCAQFLTILRQQLGDEALFNGLQRYYASNTFGIGTTAEVRAALEASSGRDLGALFKQWTGR